MQDYKTVSQYITKQSASTSQLFVDTNTLLYTKIQLHPINQNFISQGMKIYLVHVIFGQSVRRWKQE